MCQEGPAGRDPQRARWTDGEFAYVVDLKSVQRLLVRGQQSTSLVHQALAVGGESRIPPILDEQGLVESAFE